MIVRGLSAISEWFHTVDREKLWHVIAGLVVGSFFAIVFECLCPLLPAAAAGVMKELWDLKRYGRFDWADILYTCGGGLVIQLFSILSVLIVRHIYF